MSATKSPPSTFLFFMQDTHSHLVELVFEDKIDKTEF